MKNLIMLLGFIFAAGQSYAQITLERSDYTLEIGSPVYRTHVDTIMVPMPSSGAGQLWDYTSLVQLNSDTIQLDAYSGTEFPAANASRDMLKIVNEDPIIAIFNITNYYILNDMVYGQVGVKYHHLAIPLQGLTGNPNDTLNYFESYGDYPGDPDNLAWFPMNFGDTSISDYTLNNEFELTVGMLGLDHVPCLNKVEGATHNEVVGWGTLSLINPTGQNKVDLEVLLMKKIIVETDSFFMAGELFPESLLAILGMEQGQQSTSESYRFFAKGFSSPVLTFNGEVGESWIPSDLTPFTAVEEMQDHAIAFRCYPNPASDHIIIGFEKSTGEPWLFVIYNSLGQKIFEERLAQPAGKVSKSIEFGQKFQSGNYFFVLYDDNQMIMSCGGLIMN